MIISAEGASSSSSEPAVAENNSSESHRLETAVASVGRERPSHLRTRWYVLWLMVVVSLMAWWVLHRYWFMSGDDYLHVEFGGRSRGGFTWDDWWYAFGLDWTERNGRFADAATRLALRPGAWFYPLFAPVMLTGTGLALAWTALRSRSGLRPLWVWAAGLLMVPTLLWMVPGMLGDAVYWASGAMNYVLPLALLVTFIGGLALLLSGKDISWLGIAALSLLAVFSDALHEMSSLSQIFVVAVVLLTQRSKFSPKLWVVMGTTMLAFVLHMSAPGLWQRAGLVNEARQGITVELLLHGIGLSSGMLWQRTELIWLLLIGALLILALFSRTRPQRLSAVIAACGVVSFVLAASAYQTRVPVGVLNDGIPEHMWLPTLGLTGAMCIMALSVAVALWRAASKIGIVPLLVWVAFVGNCGFIFAGGLTGYRAQFPPAMLVMLLLLALAAQAIPASKPETWNRRAPGVLNWEQIGLAVVVVTMLVPSVGWFDDSRVKLAQNYAFVKEYILAPLEQAALQERGTVVVPLVPPHSAFNYGAAFLLPRYDQALHDYFEIPEQVKLRNPEAQ